MARLDANGKIGAVMVDIYKNGGSVREKLSIDEFASHFISSVRIYDENSNLVATGADAAKAYTGDANEKVFVRYEIAVKNNKEIVISGDTFPGNYYVTGDTYARSDVDGSDQFFQFIIPKAKVTSENTITLEAEGDPSVFNMNLSVLRPEDGEMMKLVQYDLTAG